LLTQESLAANPGRHGLHVGGDWIAQARGMDELRQHTLGHTSKTPNLERRHGLPANGRAFWAIWCGTGGEQRKATDALRRLPQGFERYVAPHREGCERKARRRLREHPRRHRRDGIVEREIPDQATGEI
jgi:hypothetical protein